MPFSIQDFLINPNGFDVPGMSENDLETILGVNSQSPVLDQFTPPPSQAFEQTKSDGILDQIKAKIPTLGQQPKRTKKQLIGDILAGALAGGALPNTTGGGGYGGGRDAIAAVSTAFQVAQGQGERRRQIQNDQDKQQIAALQQLYGPVATGEYRQASAETGRVRAEADKNRSAADLQKALNAKGPGTYVMAGPNKTIPFKATNGIPDLDENGHMIPLLPDKTVTDPADQLMTTLQKLRVDPTFNLLPFERQVQVALGISAKGAGGAAVKELGAPAAQQAKIAQIDQTFNRRIQEAATRLESQIKIDNNRGRIKGTTVRGTGAKGLTPKQMRDVRVKTAASVIYDHFPHGEAADHVTDPEYADLFTKNDITPVEVGEVLNKMKGLDFNKLIDNMEAADDYEKMTGGGTKNTPIVKRHFTYDPNAKKLVGK